jgi:hypothetical protein
MNNNIWKIGLFNKLPGGKAECKDCKEKKRDKYIFERSNGSTKSLHTHLISKLHSDSDYTKRYHELEQEKASKENPKQQKIPFNVISSGNNLIILQNNSKNNFNLRKFEHNG